ncbi:MAG: hypothetical protein M1818_008133 [Claussenomyces sp. TS43310]|nr:MAG: hypothetical protein M1818_008133 [Claussenomyces sp. TS43310]
MPLLEMSEQTSQSHTTTNSKNLDELQVDVDWRGWTVMGHETKALDYLTFPQRFRVTYFFTEAGPPETFCDKMNRYWLPNLEINKKVITQELQFYLGPDAQTLIYEECHADPEKGEDGFLITTPGPYASSKLMCNPKEQIDDICEKSREVWKKQAEARSRQESDKAIKSDKPLKRPLNQPILVSRGLPSSDSSFRSRERDDRRRGGSRKRSDERRYDDDLDRRRSGDDRREGPQRDDRRRDDRYR